MRIASANYPEEIDYPPFNDSAWRFAVQIMGGAGRQLRLSETYAEPSWSYDNVFVRFNDSETRGYVHGAASPGTVYLGLLSSDDVVSFTSGGSQGYGAFTFLVEIETGPGTGEYVPLTTSQVDEINVIEAGTPYAEATDYGGGPAPIACFWTDLTANLVQDCGDEPAPDPDPPAFVRTYAFDQDNGVMFGSQTRHGYSQGSYGSLIVFNNTIRYTPSYYDFENYIDPVRISLAGVELYRYPRTAVSWEAQHDFVRALPDVEMVMLTPLANWPNDNGLLGRLFEGGLSVGSMDPAYVYYVRFTPTAYDANNDPAAYTNGEFAEGYVFDTEVEGDLPMEIAVTPVHTGVARTVYLAGALAESVYSDDWSEVIGTVVLACYRGTGLDYEDGGCSEFEATTSVTTGTLTVQASCS